MTRTKLVLSIAATLAIAACGNGSDLEEQGTLSEPGAPATPAAGQPTTSTPDAEFLGDVLSAGLKEVELGRLAETQATRPEVKEFARMVVQDHQQANDRVRQIITDASLSVTPDMEPLQDARDRVASLTGIEFDRAFINMMIESHEDSIETLEGKTTGDAAPSVRSWASDTLPVVQRHLQRAQEIQRLIAGGAGGAGDAPAAPSGSRVAP